MNVQQIMATSLVRHLRNQREEALDLVALLRADNEALRGELARMVAAAPPEPEATATPEAAELVVAPTPEAVSDTVPASSDLPPSLPPV